MLARGGNTAALARRSPPRLPLCGTRCFIFNVRASLACLAACLAVAAACPVAAQSDSGDSLLIFPKVVSDGSADSIVQVANQSASRVDVFCAYVDGRVGWQASGFHLSLLARQPLHWVVSRGREADDGVANGVPPAPDDFRGELVCVETDVTGAPAGGNRLTGRATVAALDDGDAIAYPAVGLRGLGLYDGDDVLCIGQPSDTCIFGAEYDACPAGWLVNHPAPGAADRQLGGGSRLDTRITIVPCSQNIRDGEPGSVTVDVQVTSELAQRFSFSASVTCWADLSLADLSPILDVETLGGEAAWSEISPRQGSGAFVVVAEVERRAANDGAVLGRTALAAYPRGASDAADAIVLPMGLP